jgi:hypothetical protein
MNWTEENGHEEAQDGAVTIGIYDRETLVVIIYIRQIVNIGDAFNAEDAIWSTFWKEHTNYMQTDSDG